MELNRAPMCLVCGKGLRILPTTQLVAEDLADEAWLASRSTVDEARFDVACENGHASVPSPRAVPRDPLREEPPAPHRSSHRGRRG